MTELEAALRKPVVYVRGKHMPTTFLISMPYWVVRGYMRKGKLHVAAYNPNPDLPF